MELNSLYITFSWAAVTKKLFYILSYLIKIIVKDIWLQNKTLNGYAILTENVSRNKWTEGGGARGVMVIVTTRVQILDKTDCNSHSANTLEKSMNPIILPPAMGK